jgi:excinuclease ABC subunit A
MSRSSAQSVIRLRGVRHNNLKNFDLDLPLNQLIVITGLSGSGKSSLAFDTLFAEGQRRYIETFSPYARQFFDRMDKPQVDSIEGIPPAIAIEQRNAVRTTRSTVGTMTEICDHMKVLWPHHAKLHCRQCGQIVRKDPPREIWETIKSSSLSSSSSTSKSGEDEDEGRGRAREKELLVTFDVPLSEKLSIEESLALVGKQGYRRILVGDEILSLDDPKTRSALRTPPSALTVVQDRLKLTPANRARFVEACEQAYHFGKGKLTVRETGIEDEDSRTRTTKDDRRPGKRTGWFVSRRFSNRWHCANCDIEYREPTPALFSFNHPLGACPACRGFGRIISIDYDLAIPDRSLTLAEGVIRPWRTGFSAECQSDLAKFCKVRRVPMNVPFTKLSADHQRWVIEGDPDYGKDEEHEWPRAWYGVKGYFRWLESKAYKMHVRVLLSRYRAYTTCPQCRGARFQPESLLYQLVIDDLRFTTGRLDERPENPIGSKNKNQKSKITLADFYALPVRDALRLIDECAAVRTLSATDPVNLVFKEIRARLAYLDGVGLGYLTLDRPTRSLSGGETERVNLTTCLGTRLVNTLFVLDEPSVGLHPRDTERLVRILQQLRDAGNTVVVVEHEASVMRAADRIIDLGPGHGATGGQIVFQGTYSDILKSDGSLTGEYLSGRRQIEIPPRRPVAMPEADAYVLKEAVPRYRAGRENGAMLRLAHATRHNLNDVSVEIPLGRLVCVSGVSGSGKTTLVREVLLPALESKLQKAADPKEKAEGRRQKAEDGEQTTENSEVEAESTTDEDNPSALRTPHSALVMGWEHLSRVVLVDQSILGKTPRSNPAVYIGAFDEIREFFAQSEAARRRGLNASAFSFNSSQGHCERCRGAGFEKIEMQFLSDIFIRCPDCDGRRYRRHILEIKIQKAKIKSEAWSIADMLEATVDEAMEFLDTFPDSRPARRAIESLRLLQEVGLGYLRLGQPINTLSGGESQRLKLVRYLAEAAVAIANRRDSSVSEGRDGGLRLRPEEKPTLFLFDEPTTGLHFDDVRVLLKVFQRLVDSGHSVVVVEHNLDVIRSADWIIDLGPGAGDEGGRMVAQGTPEQVAGCARSHTGAFLRDLIGAAPVADPLPSPRSGRARGTGRRLCATIKSEG